MSALHAINPEHIYAVANGLCDSAPQDSEYVRGQAELICDLIGIPLDNKRDVIERITHPMVNNSLYPPPAPDDLYAALAVIVKDPGNRQLLEKVDPMALKQADTALALHPEKET